MLPVKVAAGSQHRGGGSEPRNDWNSLNPTANYLIQCFQIGNTIKPFHSEPTPGAAWWSRWSQVVIIYSQELSEKSPSRLLGALISEKHLAKLSRTWTSPGQGRLGTGGCTARAAPLHAAAPALRLRCMPLCRHCGSAVLCCTGTAGLCGAARVLHQQRLLVMARGDLRPGKGIRCLSLGIHSQTRSCKVITEPKENINQKETFTNSSTNY